MKLLVAAALLGSALAHGPHLHDRFHRRDQPSPSCSCVTRVITYYDEPKLVEPTTHATTTVRSTSYTTVTVSVTDEPALPTNVVTVYPTPGTYTVPATTIVVPRTTTVCDATSTALTPGTQTYGGVTTVVPAPTTMTVPYAAVEPVGSTFTSVIKHTVFVCPSAGTYTVAPTTTTVVSSTVVVYPTPATFTPGTYTRPAQTLTVTRTNEVVVCPGTTNVPAPAPPVKAPVSVPAAPTNAPEPPKAPAPAPQPAPPKAPAPAPAPPKTPSPPTQAPGGGLGGGDKWGMTYSPYTNESGCKSAGTISADIAAIKKAGFRVVRIYSTDCDGLNLIGSAARSQGLRLVLGVFIAESGISGAQKQVSDITSWRQWDLVDLIVVGNEAVHSNRAQAGPLAAFINSSRATFRAAGYSGPVTTTEPTNVWQAHGAELCGAVDVLGANIHCFFNPDVTAPNCGKFVAGQMELLAKICPGKQVLNLETGYPSQGSPNSAAVPGPAQQKAAISSLVSAVGAHSVFFSFGDDLWKQPGPFGVEQHWGCINLF